MRVSLNVIFSPLLKLSFFHKNVRLVHDLQIESVVLINAFDFIVLCVFNQLQDVIALHDNLLLLFSGHIVAQDFGYDLSIKHLFELNYGILMLCRIISYQTIELLFMDGLNVILGNLSIRCLNALFLDLPNAFFEIGNVAGR